MAEKRKAAGMLVISSLTWVQLVQRHMTGSKPLWFAASSRCRIAAWSVTRIRLFRSILLSLSGESVESSDVSWEVPDEDNGMAMLQHTCMWRTVSLTLHHFPYIHCSCVLITFLHNHIQTISPTWATNINSYTKKVTHLSTSKQKLMHALSTPCASIFILCTCWWLIFHFIIFQTCRVFTLLPFAHTHTHTLEILPVRKSLIPRYQGKSAKSESHYFHF